MNIKQSTLAAAITTALAMGAAGHAAASTYAGSSLDIQNLTLNITPATGSFVFNYKFDLANTALLNGSPDNTGNLSTSCGTTGGATACSVVSPVLAADAANAPGSTIQRTDGSLTNWDFYGPGAQTYANSDSEITTASLVQFPTPTATKQIAEANIEGTGNGQSSTTVQSNTTFLFSFTLAGPGTLVLDFDADVDVFTQVDTLNLIDALAQANSGASFTLSGGGQSVVWTPNGQAGGFTTCSGGLICTEDNDEESLTQVIATGSLGTINNPGSSGYSDNRTSGPLASPDLGFSDFGITIGGLLAGTYSLALNATTSVSVAQQVPEPGVLALMGIGLLGLGMSARRKKLF